MVIDSTYLYEEPSPTTTTTTTATTTTETHYVLEPNVVMARDNTAAVDEWTSLGTLLLDDDDDDDNDDVHDDDAMLHGNAMHSGQQFSDFNNSPYDAHSSSSSSTSNNIYNNNNNNNHNSNNNNKFENQSTTSTYNNHNVTNSIASANGVDDDGVDRRPACRYYLLGDCRIRNCQVTTLHHRIIIFVFLKFIYVFFI
jgi:hypothetical protein